VTGDIDVTVPAQRFYDASAVLCERLDLRVRRRDSSMFTLDGAVRIDLFRARAVDTATH
jgi:hypothetical protein